MSRDAIRKKIHIALSLFIIKYIRFQEMDSHAHYRLQRWPTILLNISRWNFNRQKKNKQLGQAHGLTRLIYIEDTVLISLESESEMKSMVFDTIKKLPVTLDDIKIHSKNNTFIKEL